MSISTPAWEKNDTLLSDNKQRVRNLKLYHYVFNNTQASIFQ